MEDNLEFSYKTAQNYMKVYTNQDSLKNETVSFLREAYQSPVEHKPEKKQEEVLEVEVVPAPEGRLKRFDFPSCSKMNTISFQEWPSLCRNGTQDKRSHHWTGERMG